MLEDDEWDSLIDVALQEDENPAYSAVDSDVEDPVERNEYEVAIVVAEYRDDYPIRHDSYYDSDWEGEAEENRGYTPRRDGNLKLGHKFFNGLAFKEAVLHYALKNKRNIRQKKYDRKKISFVCLGRGESGIACRWRVYASIRKGKGKWEVSRYTEDHLCQKGGECKLLKVTAIARLFVDRIREDPDRFRPADIEESIWDTWGISVTRNQTQSARLMALKWIEAEFDDQFRRLRDYASELLLSNPGSFVQVECYKNAAGHDVFNKFYVLFDVLRRSWKATCRPLLGIDATFVKSRVKEQLLVALGRDGDNRIYPLAWAVVAVENIENWTWFIRKLKVDLDLGEGEGYVIISDRQKGLIRAVSDELSQVEHRHCVRHIYTNLKSKFGKRDPMKKFIWDLAWSYNEIEFEERLQDVKNFDEEVYDWVIKSEPRSWCRAFYKVGPHCEDVENNSTESFNRTIVKAREKAFVPMLETIRTLAMTRIAKRNKESMKRDETLTPYASELLLQEEETAQSGKVKSSTNGMFQAAVSGCSHRVSLERKTCTYRKWQIRGIPCEHAYGVILHTKLPVHEFVSGWFHTAVWRKTYEEGIIPPRGARFWPRGDHPPVNYPTYTEKKSKKEHRKKGKNESPTKKKEKGHKRIMTCGQCGGRGHNSRHHRQEKNKGKTMELSNQASKGGGKGAEQGAVKKSNKVKGAKKGKGAVNEVQSSQISTQGSQSKSQVSQATGSRKKRKLNVSQSS